MADINGVIAAYESQMQRAFHQGLRGIATTEQRAAWRREAVAAIDAVADRAWHEGYVAACEHYACDTVFDETPISPYESGGER